MPTLPTVPPHRVTPAWLADHLTDPQVRILDARLLDSYRDRHIPGAQHSALTALRCQRAGVEGMVIPPEPFATLASAWGISADTVVVIYDDYFGQLAARTAWTFLYYGHAAVAVLEGGWDAWEAAGLPITAAVKQPPAARFVSVTTPDILAEHAWVRSQTAVPGVVLLDVRTSSEYERGHLPNAIHWNWENGIDPVTTFRPAAALLAELAALGVAPEQTIVPYCQSGMRAAHTYLLLRSLGFERVRLYDGSWAEWSRREGNALHAG